MRKDRLLLFDTPKSEVLTEVVLTYFKPNGKFYSQGKYLTGCTNMSDLVDEVTEMKESGTLTSIEGKDWIIHVAASDDRSWTYPALLGL